MALVTQYAFDMQPCAWCVLQRLIFVTIAAVAALALPLRAPVWRGGFSGVIVLLAGSGVVSALYQHFVAARSSSCRLSLAEKIVNDYLHLDTLLPSVFGIWANCSDAASLLGMPYEFWSLAVFSLIALGVAATIVRGFSPERGP